MPVAGLAARAPQQVHEQPRHRQVPGDRVEPPCHVGRSTSPKRINNLERVEFLTVLQIFGIQNGGPGFLRRTNDQCIPERELVPNTHADRAENQVWVDLHDRKISQTPDGTLRFVDFERYGKLSSDSDEELLKHLGAQGRTSRTRLASEQLSGRCLLLRCVCIEKIDEYVRIEERAHQRRSYSSSRVQRLLPRRDRLF